MPASYVSATSPSRKRSRSMATARAEACCVVTRNAFELDRLASRTLARGSLVAGEEGVGRLENGATRTGHATGEAGAVGPAPPRRHRAAECAPRAGRGAGSLDLHG